ncbi:hypothetical protein N0V84_009814 [Fusarium piperis]|uniref:Uncharacterized protein n=1 Tax=Fusarium piperis TaxID=1435070 RepID=A0A9W8W5L9_9HYPO|nr:hypothetical protein N0V84_009814 [Fusarium piperis]
MSNTVATVEQGTLSRLIKKHPDFAAGFKHSRLCMKPVLQGAAHILVHYLYTGRYEGLKALDIREIDKAKFNFQMATLTPMLQLGITVTILDQQEFTHIKISGWLRDYISDEVGKYATPDAIRVMRDDMQHNRAIAGIVCGVVAGMGLESQRLHRAL